MNKNLLLIGGGGHCKSVLDSILKFNQYSNIGIVDIKENIGKYILDIPIIGCDNDLLELYQKGYSYAFIAVGSVGESSLRVKLNNMIEKNRL